MKPLPSEQHIQSWNRFENTVLYYRSNVIQLFNVFHWILYVIQGRANFNESEKLLEEDVGGEVDKEVAQAILPYAKWAHITATFFRIVLLAISYKKPRVCRFYFYYELMVVLIDQCMPKNISLDRLEFLILLLNLINFFAFTIDFLPNLIAANVSQIIFTVIWVSVY